MSFSERNPLTRLQALALSGALAATVLTGGAAIAGLARTSSPAPAPAPAAAQVAPAPAPFEQESD